MDKLGTQLRKYARVSLAGFMSVWLSGIVFLFCCHGVSASPAAETCPMAKMSSHCDNAKKQNADSYIVEPSPADCIECGYLPVVFEKTRKLEQVQKQAARIEKAVAVQLRQPETEDLTEMPRTVFTRVSFPKKIFIKNCVFRI